MIRKIGPLVAAVMLLGALDATAQKSKAKNATVVDYLPSEALAGVSIGMHWDSLRSLFGFSESDLEFDPYDSVTKVTRFFPPGSDPDELASAAFYFPAAIEELPPNARLFQVVLEFAGESANQFAWKYRDDPKMKSKLTEDGWQWRTKPSRPAGLEVLISLRGSFITVTGTMRGKSLKELPSSRHP
ncbi:MAG TPA: hypothetical protein VEB63_08700 [Chitinophagaceae bacterium]|nr:hypothetical protein [Chitinophagaceae bacterium]